MFMFGLAHIRYIVLYFGIFSNIFCMFLVYNLLNLLYKKKRELQNIYHGIDTRTLKYNILSNKMYRIHLYENMKEEVFILCTYKNSSYVRIRVHLMYV